MGKVARDSEYPTRLFLEARAYQGGTGDGLKVGVVQRLDVGGYCV
jgi:hypothetical protein